MTALVAVAAVPTLIHRIDDRVFAGGDRDFAGGDGGTADPRDL
jgi:hypothetical protein